MNNSGRDGGTRVALLETAARLFAERGFDGVSVRDIIGAAQANLGSITYHFGGKQELFGEVMARKIEPLIHILHRVTALHVGPREKLALILRQAFMHILHHDPSLKALFAEAIRGGDRLPRDVLMGLEERNRVIRAIIEEGIRLGEFRSCDTEAATWIFFGMLMPYVLHEPLINPARRHGPYSEAFVNKVVDAALEIFFGGIGP